MDRLDAMRGFLAVADRASFAEAARQLRWSPATTTRAVAMLEAEFGVALFNRTTRAVRLTERGALLADKCRELLAEIESVRSLVRGEDAAPRGTLSVTAPVLFGRLHVLPVAEALGAAHPGLVIRLTFVDRVTHLVEEGFDVAVRIGDLAESALVAVKVAEVHRVVVASPAYLARAGRPNAPAELRQHRIISFDGVGSTDDWRFGPQGQTVVRITPQLSINAADAVIDAVERGQGVARLLSYQVREAVAAGRLCRILAESEPEPVPVSLVYQASRRASPNIQAFVGEARRYFARTRLCLPEPS
ncbi:LysR family transcriptional regulator [Falsiroseomonas tokyonensis]|uniref:LysR family transcriptional regulator n=1 Tax=Falsiroseomonas tokyonensis TaxID=430521 RepID=A0ABV7BTP0_9PROT|nr:LysR family transcriptional regulator [Falsiroseomonas tokyonensis]MBU8537843.1 LysR family transcriptional regulator [Falsiroseomonas tokyonensis]